MFKQAYIDYTLQPCNFTFNIFSVVVTLQGDYIISDGGLPGKYKAAQFHFHWGSYDQQGAEHGIDGIFAPAEVSMFCAY